MPREDQGDRINFRHDLFLGTDYTDYAEACAMYFLEKIRVIRVIRA